MEACSIVEREADKVLSKFTEINQQAIESLQDALNNIEYIRQELKEASSDSELTASWSLLLSQFIKKTKETVQKLSADHKDLHGSVSKVGKAIDRNFVSDFSCVVPDTIFDDEAKQQQLNHVICEHFLRQGMLDIAENLVNESGLEVDEQRKEPFLELHRILEALKRQDLEPALEWAKVNRDALQAQNSSLEFRLHRLRFIELVKEGPSSQNRALNYARHFAPFAVSHAKELQVLMGTLLYLQQGLENSPYARLLDPIHWLEICDVFTRDACALLGLSVESPLSVVVKAGCKALPPLLNIKQVMPKVVGCGGPWDNPKDELPVEINLGRECQFHSVFACPILRQQSTESNPPVRLVCGHVISRDALNKLANGNKVKCPYCPVEQTPADARQIFF